MTAESHFSVTGKAGGTLVTLRGDSYDEFVANAKRALGDAEGQAYALSVFKQALLHDVPEAQAVGNLNAGGVTVTTPSVVQQPNAALPPNVVPMPGTQPQAVPNPPTLPYPGDCAHGPRQYKDTKTARGQWRRWECSVPWSRGADNSARCEAINA